jgi:alkaline phosphatase
MLSLRNIGNKGSPASHPNPNNHYLVTKIKQRAMRTFLSLTWLLCGAITTAAQAPIQPDRPPKNVILLIGDGMGLAQVSTAFFYQDKPSNFERFPVTGLIETSSSSDKITDSAAGATAFSAGVSTYNGAIGVDPNEKPVPTLVEILSEEGLSTGLVATSSITHATPASFYAHVASRNSQDDIAKQLLTSEVDFFAGGGTDFFVNREDKINYYDSAAAYGFKIDTTELSAAGNRSLDQRYGYLLAPDGMPRMLDDRGNFLPEATQQAVDYLSQNEAGFFLMVEGSQIDWGGHANDAQYIITEVLDFDQALGVALDFAEKDGNTLVVVTADHETGGFALSASGQKSGSGSDYNELNGTFSTGGHTATLIPVFAYGPGAEAFGGIYKNTEIFHKIMRTMHPESSSSAERE